MKKIIIILLIICLCGCTKTTDESVIKYKDMIKELNKVDETTENIPFDVEVVYDELVKKVIRYQVIIDNPKEDIYEVEALSIHNIETDDIFPSIGIFDDKEDLLMNKKPSGIILVGYIDKDIKLEDIKVKVLIKYKLSDQKEYKVYYVTK